jgi:hypothetical protein
MTYKSAAIQDDSRHLGHSLYSGVFLVDDVAQIFLRLRLFRAIGGQAVEIA